MACLQVLAVQGVMALIGRLLPSAEISYSAEFLLSEWAKPLNHRRLKMFQHVVRPHPGTGQPNSWLDRSLTIRFKQPKRIYDVVFFLLGGVFFSFFL